MKEQKFYADKSQVEKFERQQEEFNKELEQKDKKTKKKINSMIDLVSSAIEEANEMFFDFDHDKRIKDFAISVGLDSTDAYDFIKYAETFATKPGVFFYKKKLFYRLHNKQIMSLNDYIFTLEKQIIQKQQDLCTSLTFFDILKLMIKKLLGVKNGKEKTTK